MSTIVDATRAALEPYVGPVVADTCIRATALSLGKMTDELSEADLPAIEGSMRKLLAPVAPAAAIETMVANVTRATREG